MDVSTDTWRYRIGTFKQPTKANKPGFVNLSLGIRTHFFPLLAEHGVSFNRGPRNNTINNYEATGEGTSTGRGYKTASIFIKETTPNRTNN